MKKLAKIDLRESIIEQKLIFNENWVDKAQRAFVIMAFTFLSIEVTCMILNADHKNINDRYISVYIAPLIITFCLYVIYRAVTEKRFTTVSMPFDKEKNISTLLQFAHAKGYDIYRNSGGCLIFNELTEDITVNKVRSFVIIPENNKILFCVFKEGLRGSLPVLTAHIFFKHDIKKFFSGKL